MEVEVGPELRPGGRPARSGPAVLPYRSVTPHALAVGGTVRRPKGGGQVALTAVAIVPIWVGCLVVGFLGMLLPYQRAHLQRNRPPVIAAPLPVHLDLKQMAPPDAGPPQVSPRPDAAPPPDVSQPPQAPDLPQVAAPSNSIAFAVPVEGPVRIVAAKLAVPVARPAAVVPPAVRHLTLGVGEGQQPSPDYPLDAQLAREQGSVVVRFTVGQDGHVQSAEVTQPSRWPLLNQAALRVVRDRWVFAPGPVRVFDIPFEFRINER